MKLYLLAALIIFPSLKSFSQKEPACKCADAQLALAPDTTISAAYEIKQAEAIVGGFVDLINKNTKDFKKHFKESIFTKPAPCAKNNLALAVLCDGNLNNTRKGRYILYDANSVDAIVKSTNFKKNADWFILAHEVGHHICNHLHDVDYLMNEQKKLDKYNKAEDPCKGKNCDIIKKNHTKELEADAVAVWLLKKSDVPDQQILSMISKISDFVKIEFDQATSTHPSFFVRQKMANKILTNWKKDFANDTSPVEKSLKFVETEYEEILFDIDEQAKIYLTALENAKIAQLQHYKKSNELYTEAKKNERIGKYDEAINSYTNALQELELTTYFDEKDKEIITKPLEALQRIIKRKVFYKIVPVIGLNYSIPSFNAEGQIIETITKPSASYGLRIGRYHWQSSNWYELNIATTKSIFTTLTTNNGQKQSVEDFSLNCLSTNLRYVFTNLGNKKDPIQNWKTDFIGTIGPVFNYYYNNIYTNNLLDETKRPLIVKPNVGAFIGFGAERLSRKKGKPFGNYRIMINYCFQNIKFGESEPTRPNYKFWLHQVGISLSYRQW